MYTGENIPDLHTTNVEELARAERALDIPHYRSDALAAKQAIERRGKTRDYSQCGLTQAKLQGIVHYDKESGVFTKLSNGMRYQATDNGGYVRVSLGKYGAFQAHILAWFYVTGEWPDGIIKKRDFNPNNNAWDNLVYISKDSRVFYGFDVKPEGVYVKSRIGVNPIELIGPFESVEVAKTARQELRNVQL